MFVGLRPEGAQPRGLKAYKHDTPQPLYAINSL